MRLLLAMMPIEFKLNGQTVIGRPDEKIIETAKKHAPLPWSTITTG